MFLILQIAIGLVIAWVLIVTGVGLALLVAAVVAAIAAVVLGIAALAFNYLVPMSDGAQMLVMIGIGVVSVGLGLLWGFGVLAGAWDRR